jgi:hypothetical protein
MFGFAMLIIPPLLVVGATLGYISVVLLALVIKDGAAISFSAYLLSTSGPSCRWMFETSFEVVRNLRT